MSHVYQSDPPLPWYEASRMYGARATFKEEYRHGFLLRKKPRVLATSTSIPLRLPGLSDIGPPPAMPTKKSKAKRPVRLFNPSLARAPAGLCPKCTWAISLRVDQLHQCSSETSPYTAGQALLGSVDWFQATAIAILDAELKLLGWTWMVNAPSYQIAAASADLATLNQTGCLGIGGGGPGLPSGTDGFMPPPFAKQTFDARLLHLNGELLVTYACSSCVFSMSTLRATADATPDGGLTRLRIWATERFTYQHAPWLAGRNQALFVYPPLGMRRRARARLGRNDASSSSSFSTTTTTISSSSSAAAAAGAGGKVAMGIGDVGTRASLMVQPRLGMVGELGRNIRYHRKRVAACVSRTKAEPRPAPAVFEPSARRGRFSPMSHAAQRAPPIVSNCHGEFRRSGECGTWPDGAEVQQRTLVGLYPHKAELIANASRALHDWLHVTGTFGGLSLTSHLVHLRRRCAPADSATSVGHTSGRLCDVYLGVGHLHRGEGESNRHLYRRRQHGPAPWDHAAAATKPDPLAPLAPTAGSSAHAPRLGNLFAARTPSRRRRRLAREQPFVFGFRYTHFWYALAPRPPFGVVAASGEFCLASPQDATDCESVQFISGLGMEAARPSATGHGTSSGGDADKLLLTYGVNDCEARLATLPTEVVWSMLEAGPPHEK